MPQYAEKPAILSFQLEVDPDEQSRFLQWQAKLNAQMVSFPGFLSLEFLSPSSRQKGWLIVQRFEDERSVSAWRSSDTCQTLMTELKSLATRQEVNEISMDDRHLQGGITEVIVTEVAPERENAFKEWCAKIHRAEAEFPGFRGAYLQAPGTGQKRHWITLLQFDTRDNLDRWLQSPQRQELIKESEPLVSSMETHRVVSPYAGWFASLAKVGDIPPVWKQTMIVLLVLFPIVMLELKYLSPWTKNLNLSPATFIGNAISVSLISFPLMPIAIWLLGWWLSPSGKRAKQATILGTFLVVGLYLIEIALFWNFL